LGGKGDVRGRRGLPGGGRAAQRVGTGGRATGPASHRGGEGWSVGRETSLARKWFARVHYGMVRQTRETREEPMAGGLAQRTVAGRGGGEGELGGSERVREGTGSSEGLSESGGLPTGLKVGDVGCQLE